jgi:hypothetical protein
MSDYRLLALGLAVIGVMTLSRVIVENRKVQRATVLLALDASRRWLTISGVHPLFVDAVRHSNTDLRTRSAY